MSASSQTIDVTLHKHDTGKVAWVLIDNQRKLNTLNTALLDRLIAALTALQGDESLRAVVLTGAGSKSFIGGADINEMVDFDAAKARAFITRIHGVCQALRDMPVPAIARIDGYCLGAGLEVAAACDLRAASDKSVFGMPEVKVGVPSVVEACLLPRLIGWGRTSELLLTGENIDANTAAAWGFIEKLVPEGQLDKAVERWLASILAGMRLKNPEWGYATDFVTHVMKPLAREIAAKKIKVVSNAGGVNPLACAEAVRKIAAAQGVNFKIAVVLGDDLHERADEMRRAGVAEMETGVPLPDKVVSMNAYLGGIPIARALDKGADIVITGRCVDSAVALGPLIHEFGWSAQDYDKLAMGSLAGHIIECGAQCNGGNFTDWQLVPDYDNIGFPVIEVGEDGSFIVGKPPGTGGLITPATVGEQMLYEIGDPRAYLLPDVSCDFTAVTMRQVGKDRVLVEGAIGRPPTGFYKTSATYADGFKLTAAFMMGGIEAAKKGRHIAEAIIKRTRRIFRERNLGDYRDVSIETLGAEATYGPHSRVPEAREVVVKIAAKHDQKEALTILGREISPMGTGGVPGMSGFSGGGGRATPAPVIRLFSCLTPKDLVPIEIDVDGRRVKVAVPTTGGFDPDSLPNIAGPEAKPQGPSVTVPLVALAYGRSGDKGDNANIGIIARKPDYMPLLRAVLSEQAVARYFAHRLQGGKVTRWELPGIHGFNFLLTHALGGGGVASLQADPQAKAYAQMLLDFPVPVPQALAKELQQNKAA